MFLLYELGRTGADDALAVNGEFEGLLTFPVNESCLGCAQDLLCLAQAALRILQESPLRHVKGALV